MIMKKEDRLKIYRKYDGHCAYCGKSIEYKDMQVDHLVPKNRGCYSRWSDKDGKFVAMKLLTSAMPSRTLLVWNTEASLLPI